jgi:hypothetical protein
MSLPINKREFDLFLSHAHKDHAFVAQLDRWLTQTAGLSVWYDARELGGGSLLATDLQRAIGRCRGVLLIASDEALERGWVKAEYNCAMDERAEQEGFRVVALRVANANMKELMRGTTWIDVAGTGVDVDTALALLRALYPGEKRPNPATARDVFISGSWHPDDSRSARTVCTELVDQGFRLIGDAKDQAGFGTGNRVERILESCGAFVGVLPYRGSAAASADQDPYKYFVRELDLAASLGLPSVVIADPRLQRADGPDVDWLRMETDAQACPPNVTSALQGLWDRWRAPTRPQYVFCAMDLDDAGAASPVGPVRHLIERVTGLPTVVGTDVQGGSLPADIMRRVCDAFVVLADISGDNVNACIEAGMGLAAGTNVKLMSRGTLRSPPFMLRAAGQLTAYGDNAERLGAVHQLLRPYRRRVINSEL